MNRNSYNKIAAQWNVARRTFFGREREYLEAILEAAPPGACVLDLGCGTGRPMAEYVVSRGRHVVGVDQADELLAIAREHLPEETWILSAIEKYDFRHQYASAIVWDTLFHIRRSEHESILRKVVAGLPAGGRLMITVGGSEHPAFTDFMFGEEFSYDSNTPEQTAGFLERLACRVLIGEFMNMPDGKNDKGRYAFVAEKAEVNVDFRTTRTGKGS